MNVTEFFREKYQKAKKEHICDCCGMTIKKNELYYRCVGKFNGDFFDYKCDLGCVKLTDKFWLSE